MVPTMLLRALPVNGNYSVLATAMFSAGMASSRGSPYCAGNACHLACWRMQAPDGYKLWSRAVPVGLGLSFCVC